METDCYKLLGIPSTADDDQIRKAFRVKSLEIHPDVNTSANANEEFILLKFAQDTLLDPTKRLQHDRAFGYYKQPKNKYENAKQNYSEYQKKKAESTVKEWSKDYDVAMRMREEQRMNAIRKAKGRMVFILGFLLGAVALTAFLLIYFFA